MYKICTLDVYFFKICMIHVLFSPFFPLYYIYILLYFTPGFRIRRGYQTATQPTRHKKAGLNLINSVKNFRKTLPHPKLLPEVDAVDTVVLLFFVK